MRINRRKEMICFKEKILFILFRKVMRMLENDRGKVINPGMFLWLPNVLHHCMRRFEKNLRNSFSWES